MNHFMFIRVQIIYSIFLATIKRTSVTVTNFVFHHLDDIVFTVRCERDLLIEMRV